MKIEDIKSIQSMQLFIEGCINDFKYGITTEEDTIKNLGDYTFKVIDLVIANKAEYESQMITADELLNSIADVKESDLAISEKRASQEFDNNMKEFDRLLELKNNE